MVVIVDTFRERGIKPTAVPDVICASHGSFTWGKDADHAVYHAVVLEKVAKMAILTHQIRPGVVSAPSTSRTNTISATLLFFNCFDYIMYGCTSSGGFLFYREAAAASQ